MSSFFRGLVGVALILGVAVVLGAAVSTDIDHSVRFEKFVNRRCQELWYFRPHLHWGHVWTPERWPDCLRRCIDASDCAGFNFQSKTSDVGPHYQCMTCKYSIEGGSSTSSGDGKDLFHMRNSYTTVRTLTASGSGTQYLAKATASYWQNSRAAFPGRTLVMTGSGLPETANVDNTRLRLRPLQASGPNLAQALPQTPILYRATLLASTATEITVKPTHTGDISVKIPGCGALRPLTRYVVSLRIRGDSDQSTKAVAVYLGAGASAVATPAVWGQIWPVTGRKWTELNAGWQTLEFPLWSGNFVPDSDVLSIWLTGSFLTEANITIGQPELRVATPLNPTRLSETNFALTDSPSSAKDQSSVAVATDGANQPSKSGVVVVDLCDVADNEIDSVVLSASVDSFSVASGSVVIEAQRLDLDGIGTGDGSAMSWTDLAQTTADPSMTTTVSAAALQVPTANLELHQSFSSSAVFVTTPSVPPAVTIPGAVGNAIELDGTQTIVESATFLGGAAQFTLAAFVKPNVAVPGSTCQTILEWGEAGNAPQVSLSACAKSIAPAATVRFSLTTEGGDTIAGDPLKLDLAPERWTHLALAVDLALGTATVFQDGLPWTQTNFTTASTPATLASSLVSPKLTTGSGFVGGIDEVRVYSSALADDDVKRLARGALIKWDVTHVVPRNKSTCAKVAFVLQARTFAANDEVSLGNLRVDVLSSNDDPVLQAPVSSIDLDVSGFPGRFQLETDALAIKPADLSRYFDGSLTGWWAADIISEGQVNSGEQSVLEILPHQIAADTRTPSISSANGWRESNYGDNLIETGTRISVSGSNLDGASVVIGNLGIKEASNGNIETVSAIRPECPLDSMTNMYLTADSSWTIHPVGLPPGVTGPMLSTQFFSPYTTSGETDAQVYPNSASACAQPARFKPNTHYQITAWWRVTNTDNFGAGVNQYFMRMMTTNQLYSFDNQETHYGDPNVWNQYNVYFKTSPTVGDAFRFYIGKFRFDLGVFPEKDTLSIAGLSIIEVPQAEAETSLVVSEIQTRSDLQAAIAPGNAVWGVGFAQSTSEHQASYLGFDLSTIPEGAFTISAQLKVTTSFEQVQGASSADHAVGVKGVKGEPTKCGASATDCTDSSAAPVAQTMVGAKSTVDSDTEYTWDLTNHINSVLASGSPSGTVWLLLESVSGSAIESSTWFNGLDLGVSYAPRLNVYFSLDAPPAICDVDAESASSNFVSCLVRNVNRPANASQPIDLSVFAHGKPASPTFQVQIVGPTGSSIAVNGFCAQRPDNAWCTLRSD